MKYTIAFLLLFVTTQCCAADVSADSSGAAPPGVQEFVIQASSYKYVPNVITVDAGKPVVLIFHKLGWAPHDFIIDDPASGLSIHRKLGKTTRIEFTPTRKGRFEFYCGEKLLFFKSHRDRGMHGLLIVK